MSTTARAAEPGRRFRLASPVAVLVVLVGFMLALIAAEWPLASLARLNVTAAPAARPGWSSPRSGWCFVIAWRRPGNALGWCLAGGTVAAVLSDDGSLYAIAAYRLRHGTLPLGWAPCSPSPLGHHDRADRGGRPVFPDGRPASPLLRWVLWLYLVPAVAWMGSAYVLTLEAIVRHATGGFRRQPAGPRQRAQLTRLWNVLQYATFVTIGLSLLLVLAGQVASFRRAAGERRCS